MFLFSNILQKFRNKRTVKRDLAFSLSLIVFISSTILILSSYHIKRVNMLDALNRKADELIDQLAGPLAFHVWNYAEKDIENIASSFFAIEEVLRVSVKYDQHEITYQSEPDYDGDMIIRSSPVSYGENVNIGTVDIALSTQKIQDSIRGELHTAFFLTLVILIIVILCVKVVLGFLLGRPLYNLDNAIKEIAQGKFSSRLSFMNQKEIRKISNEINIMARKISDREFGLKEINEYLSNIFEAMDSVIIAIDEEYYIRQINHKARKTIEWTELSPIGKNLFLSTDFFDEYIHTIKNVNDTLRKYEIYRVPVKVFSSETKYFNYLFYPHSYRKKSGVVIRIDDITNIVKSEDRFKKVQKMEIVSNLAGGLGHDFNNILSGIMGAVSLLRWELKKEADIDYRTVEENLEIIQDSSKRAENIVMQLLTLAREHKYEFADIDLNTVLKNVYSICQNSLEKSIKVEVNYSENEAVVLADQNQLEQVLLNLSINAGHAMTIMRAVGETKGGVLSFYLEKVYADDKFREIHPEAGPKNYWMISVQDTGVGMDQKLMTKIFDPFFTAKKSYKGTGLGLSMVYNIVQEHLGFMDVYSEKGVGTTVNIYLPEKKAELTEQDLIPANKVFKASGLILLCDDEPTIRKIGAEMLEFCGYSVVTAENGEKAIEIFRQRFPEIKAVILDIIMPDITGDLVYAELKAINPGIKVIISSGFRKDHRVENALREGADLFLSKPYTIQKINKALLGLLYNG